MEERGVCRKRLGLIGTYKCLCGGERMRPHGNLMFGETGWRHIGWFHRPTEQDTFRFISSANDLGGRLHGGPRLGKPGKNTLYEAYCALRPFPLLPRMAEFVGYFFVFAEGFRSSAHD